MVLPANDGSGLPPSNPSSAPGGGMGCGDRAADARLRVGVAPVLGLVAVPPSWRGVVRCVCQACGRVPSAKDGLALAVAHERGRPGLEVGSRGAACGRRRASARGGSSFSGSVGCITQSQCGVYVARLREERDLGSEYRAVLEARRRRCRQIWPAVASGFHTRDVSAGRCEAACGAPWCCLQCAAAMLRAVAAMLHGSWRCRRCRERSIGRSRVSRAWRI